MREIEENDIEIYQFPDCDSDEDEDFQDQDRTLRNSIPFAIVSATHVVEVIFVIGGDRYFGFSKLLMADSSEIFTFFNID